MELKDEKISWKKINNMYPAEIVKLLTTIVEKLKPIISDCNLLIVGSFSDGKAKYLITNKRIQYFSDIDLLLVMPDNMIEILNKQNIISSYLNTISSSIETAQEKFHIGSRYRFKNELPDFALKCESLGYKFDKYALTIYSGYSLELGASKVKFNLGNSAENICSKIWTIIRYIDLNFSHKLYDYYSRIIENAKKCMDATIEYSNKKLNTSFVIKKFKKNTGNLITLDSQLEKIITIYSVILDHILKYNYDLCISSSKDEEFDFFRVSNGKPEVLVKILFLLLEIIRDSLLNKNNKDNLRLICKYARIINLCEKCVLNDSKITKNIYLCVRYKIAQRRILFSSLFKRDRGSDFLTSLENTQTKN